METFSNLWIEWILSGLLIAIIITFPLLLGLILLSILRRSVKKDRQAFEDRVISLLEEIRNAQKIDSEEGK